MKTSIKLVQNASFTLACAFVLASCGESQPSSFNHSAAPYSENRSFYSRSERQEQARRLLNETDSVLDGAKRALREAENY